MNVGIVIFSTADEVYRRYMQVEILALTNLLWWDTECLCSQIHPCPCVNAWQHHYVAYNQTTC